jgi:hypothetical protein
MGTETVVADTTMTITIDGTKVMTNTKSLYNQHTQVNGTRNNKFWNHVEFNDNRVGPTGRILKIRTKASGDVTSQVKSNTVNRPYDPPFFLIPTPLPDTVATITYTEAETHNILVETHYEVWQGKTKEFSAVLGQYTLVEET